MNLLNVTTVFHKKLIICSFICPIARRAVGHRGKRLTCLGYPGPTSAGTDSDTSTHSSNCTMSQAAKGGSLAPPAPPEYSITCLTWLLRPPGREGTWTEAEYPGKASAPAGRSCSQPSWVNREPYLPATSTPDTRKISKETNCRPRGRCVYLPCRWASKSMLFVKISVHMWSCEHQGPRGKGNMRSHVTTGPRTGINTPACLLPSSEIRAKHFKIWDFIRWSVLNSNLSLR